MLATLLSLQRTPSRAFLLTPRAHRERCAAHARLRVILSPASFAALLSCARVLRTLRFVILYARWDGFSHAFLAHCTFSSRMACCAALRCARAQRARTRFSIARAPHLYLTRARTSARGARMPRFFSYTVGFIFYIGFKPS